MTTKPKRKGTERGDTNKKKTKLPHTNEYKTNMPRSETHTHPFPIRQHSYTSKLKHCPRGKGQYSITTDAQTPLPKICDIKSKYATKTWKSALLSNTENSSPVVAAGPVAGTLMHSTESERKFQIRSTALLACMQIYQLRTAATSHNKQ